jgi:hypothetical protein
MYVVRVVQDGELVDQKAFDRLADAEARMALGQSQTVSGEFDSMSLYEVSEETVAGAAFEAIALKDKRVRLVEFIESGRRRLSKLKLNLDGLKR